MKDMRKRRLKQSLYVLCAAVGFLSGSLFPCVGEGVILSAAQQVTAQASAKPTLAAADFTDVPENSWYYGYVDALVKSGIVVGTSAQTFSPGDVFTAAEAAAVITRYLGLENYAALRWEELAEKQTPGSGAWYAGYLQTMADVGVIKDGEYGIAFSDGWVSVTDSAACTRPLLRYEFACLITRSFEIRTDGTMSRHIPPEISPDGSSFITGGRYDGTEALYAGEIADYDAIPEAYREDVLKAYYNGIFNGDENGCFLPENPLTRAEMAKVVAVITHSSLRQRNEYRELFALYGEVKEHLITDGWNEQTLDRSFAYSLLYQSAKQLAVASSGSFNSIAYTPTPAPAGYLMEVRVYVLENGVYQPVGQRLPRETEPITADGAQLRILFVLRNSDSAKVEGVLQTDIAPNGEVTYSNRFKSVL